MTGSENVFVVVGAVGFLVLLLSFLLGFEHSFEFSHDADVGHEMEHGGEQEASGSNDLQVPSLLSTKVILAGLVGFGAFGFIASYSGLPALLSWPCALVGFFAVGVGTFFLVLKPMASQQSNSMFGRDSYVGCRGKISLSIPQGGYGQVTFPDQRRASTTERALAQDGSAMPYGTRVMIVDVAKDGVVVSTDPLAETEL